MASLLPNNKLPIMGTRAIPQKIIADDRGEVRQFMRHHDFGYKLFDATVVTNFAEVYFSLVYPDVVKAWHVHKQMCLNYVCVIGKVLVALYDPRENSPTYGVVNTHILTDHGEGYVRLTIPPGVWNGFRAPVGWAEPVMIANCADKVHDPREIVRHPPDAIPFDWGAYRTGG